MVQRVHSQTYIEGLGAVCSQGCSSGDVHSGSDSWIKARNAKAPQQMAE